MLTLGLDIGTTTISVVVAENGVVLESITKPHDSFLKGRPAWERAQDVSVLRAAALEAVAALTETEDLDQVKVGDLTVRHSSRNAAACCLRYQAELMMVPYTVDRFRFTGV